MRKKFTGQWSPVWLVLIVVAFALSASAQGTKFEDKTLSPYFFVKGDPNVDHLPLKDTSVDISVSGVIADVRVTQTYRNEGPRPINATYMFPASTRAAVYSMRMRIGDQVIYAKIKEREQAKQEFEKAKQEGKSASLLEEQRPNVFSMSLANIMQQEKVQIELRYTELLVPTDGIYEVVYPTVVGPRYPSQHDGDSAETNGSVSGGYLHDGQQPTTTLHISTRIAAGMPIREVTCISHQIAPEWLNPSVATMTLDEPDALQGNRDFILRYKLAGDKMQSGLLLFQGQDENFFLYMAQPPERIAAADIPPREYIFVLDVSGSMEGFPLKTAKGLMSDLLGRLRMGDTFNVLLFSGDSTLLSPTSLPATQDNMSRAMDLIDQQRGAGGTELLPALKTAFSLPRTGDSRSVVVVTDGYVSGEGDVFDYIRENVGSTNLFSFGIGSSVNRFLIDGMAKAGMGEPFVVTEPAQAGPVSEKFREYIESPVLTSVAVKADGFDIYDVQPSHVGDLLARRPIVIVGKWRGDVGGKLTISGKTGAGEYSDSFDVASVQPEEGNRALRYLWARSMIAELSDYGSENLSAEQQRAVTDLGLKYNLLTRYTSFIAVREKVVNPNGDAVNVDQPLPLPVGVSDMAVGDEPELWLVLIAAVMIGSIAWARYRRPSLVFVSRLS